VCEDGHSFFAWAEPFHRTLRNPARVPPLPEGATDIDILRYWLTNPVAREQLVDVLALVCERLIGILESDAEAAARAQLHQLAKRGEEVTLLRACPRCGAPLSRHFDPTEGWVDGLTCSVGHDFWYRGWRLGFMKVDGEFELWFFPADDWLASSV